MNRSKIFSKIILGMGVLSLASLVLYWLALTDIWHQNGSPDFWQSVGPASFEWKALSILYWPMLLFHICFLYFLFKGYISKKKK